MAYKTPAPEPVPFEKIDISQIKLGDRFIHRIDQFGCYYVQLRVSVNKKMNYGPAKTFYDNHYEGKENAYAEAVKFRDEHVWDFFRKINYDPTLQERRRKNAELERNRPKKFHKRKEAKSGLLSNLHYIHLRKRRNQKQHSACIVEITVNVHGEKFTSTAYSYSFQKYGGKAEAIKIAKKDRNKLAELVHRTADELNRLPAKSKEETRNLIKAVKIKQTPHPETFDPEKYIHRSFDNLFWTVKLRRQINRYDFRVPAKRFYDDDYEGKRHKSRIAARQYVMDVVHELDSCAKTIRRAEIYDQEEIETMLQEALTNAKIIKIRSRDYTNGSVNQLEGEEE